MSKSFFYFGLTAAFIVLLDQLSKFWVTAAQPLEWQVSLNTGISFGWFASSPDWIVGVLGLGMLLGILVISQKWWRQYPLWIGLFLGGGLSNLIDRWVIGGVRDWLPIPFVKMHNNLADWAIFFGLAGYIWSEWKKTQHAKH